MPLLLVVAPSGFGKSSLLSDWAVTSAGEVAWFSCRPTDADPAQFWSRLVAALTTRWPAMGSDAALILMRPSWDDANLVASLARDLAGVSAAASVVIDDLQLAEPAQAALAALAQALPGHVRLVAATQHNPVFSTSRLRVGGVLADLRSADLAFSQAEVDELLRLAGLDLPADVRGRLYSLTQGWPAGLQLAVLAMRNADDPAQVIRAFSATTREVSDYLANEVIDRIAPDLSDFATTISILDQFDADLCAAVTGREDAGRLLKQVIANDLFIQRVDLSDERYRFHPMLAAYLQARLRSRGRGAFRQAQLRAMTALQERGDLPGALYQATAVGDIQQAATLVTQSLAGTLEVGDARQARAVARGWLERFGDTAADTDPGQMLQILLALTTYGVREAERWLSALEGAHPDLAPQDDAVLQGVWADYLLNRGQSQRCLERNRRAQALVITAVAQGPVFPRLAELPLQAAGAHLIAGDIRAAAAALEPTNPVPYALIDEFRTPVLRNWVSLLEGDLALAQQSLDPLERAGAEQGAAGYGVGQIFATLLRAGCHLERRELGPASEALAEAAAATEKNGRPVIQHLVDVWLARLAIAQGNHGAAITALAQARLALADPDDPVKAQLAVEEFRVAVAFQRDSADSLVAQLPDTTESRLLRARLLLGQRAWARAAQLLEEVQPLTLRERIEWGVLRSLAEQNRDLVAAHHHLRTALELAEPHTYVATILEQGRGIVSLLRSLPAGAALRPYVETLNMAAQTSDHRLQSSAAAVRGDLSRRELTVLGMLSSRLTTQEIAGTLFVSPNTLKSHMKSIYRKLDVASRAEAVLQGEARGLL